MNRSQTLRITSLLGTCSTVETQQTWREDNYGTALLSRYGVPEPHRAEAYQESQLTVQT